MPLHWLFLSLTNGVRSSAGQRRKALTEGVQKVFGTLDLFVSLLETEIKYPILQGGILPFWTPSDGIKPGIGIERKK